MALIRDHQHSIGVATKSSEQIGKSYGENSRKIHLTEDSVDLPIFFDLSEGQRHDIVHLESLVVQLDDMSTNAYW